MNGENAIDSTCSVSNDELTKRFVEAIRIDRATIPISCQ